MGNGNIERTAPGCNLPVKRGSGNWRYRPVGSILVRQPCGTRRRPHVIVKVRDDGPESKRWRYLAIVVWEAAHGPLRDGFCLWHISGDSLDCRIGNLEAITLTERLQRNIADNAEACHAARAKQAAINGKKYWPAALDARRLKAFRRRQRSSSEAADGVAGRTDEARERRCLRVAGSRQKRLRIVEEPQGADCGLRIAD